MAKQIQISPFQTELKPPADIVFCIDCTASMTPCLAGVIREIETFVDGLMSAVHVDYRLRLIAYRDLHEPDCRHEPWHISEFTSSVAEFKSELAKVRPMGGGLAPESTLDALFLALHSKWRPSSTQSSTHKTIILMTDADTHPTITPGTYPKPDNNIQRIIQDFQELRHIMLQIVAPAYPLYQQLIKGAIDADREVVAHWIPVDDKRYEGLAAVEFGTLLSNIAQAVSQTSLRISRETEGARP